MKYFERTEALINVSMELKNDLAARILIDCVHLQIENKNYVDIPIKELVALSIKVYDVDDDHLDSFDAEHSIREALDILKNHGYVDYTWRAPLKLDSDKEIAKRLLTAGRIQLGVIRVSRGPKMYSS